MKFIADGMLGKLTRWLRILGHDVKYSSQLDDAQLITISKSENRILLTRDLELYKHATTRRVCAFYLKGRTGDEKLAELAKRFGFALDINMARSRCPKCNSRVKPILKDKVTDKVQRNTRVHYDSFWECKKCGQIYWQGAHWKGIRENLEKANRIIKATQNATT
ncbi:Mut7-C RNAse domain-containing protein [Candidatus Bathyarchaeota archaeon]|nr:Mut7-C RNAse domain-containing protein [Candidatus Bathyarchaeota archaeon]